MKQVRPSRTMKKVRCGNYHNVSQPLFREPADSGNQTHGKLTEDKDLGSERLIESLLDRGGKFGIFVERG